ncbi:Retrovirus-related Pol polyprotein from transposon TNT 1-94 [Melia azedarach]|uniref:Retrovirus-related Pol polyprotein from transposon TNT 1-94 n=1 Tax=Melia azedarach TaxID=155640 RepID=A0ACC1WX52_MELAZ|nr:Retrovirus-related Pol polyprotein from transposon TNT 1-94 [Melia azedarach]
MAIPSAPVIWSDSISAAAIASNPVLHGRTKHIEIDLHFIRDKVSAGEIEIQYISSQEQTADIMTKPLSFGKFSHFRNKLKRFSSENDINKGHYFSKLPSFPQFLPPQKNESDNAQREARFSHFAS